LFQVFKSLSQPPTVMASLWPENTSLPLTKLFSASKQKKLLWNSPSHTKYTLNRQTYGVQKQYSVYTNRTFWWRILRPLVLRNDSVLQYYEVWTFFNLRLVSPHSAPEKMLGRCGIVWNKQLLSSQ
jgi:hypothetical protein